ncbi:MAG TPA: hypothetical protein VFE47_14250 [Tepidisphaeraceae bacterium]|nr:hypothetical protein [Tepidisphaeraceae bacterium]
MLRQLGEADAGRIVKSWAYKLGSGGKPPGVRPFGAAATAGKPETPGRTS